MVIAGKNQQLSEPQKGEKESLGQGSTLNPAPGNQTKTAARKVDENGERKNTEASSAAEDASP